MHKFKSYSQLERVMFAVAMFSINRFDFRCNFVIAIRYSLCIWYRPDAGVFSSNQIFHFSFISFSISVFSPFSSDRYFGFMADFNRIVLCRVHMGISIDVHKYCGPMISAKQHFYLWIIQDSIFTFDAHTKRFKPKTKRQTQYELWHGSRKLETNNETRNVIRQI